MSIDEKELFDLLRNNLTINLSKNGSNVVAELRFDNMPIDSDSIEIEEEKEGWF